MEDVIHNAEVFESWDLLASLNLLTHFFGEEKSHELFRRMLLATTICVLAEREEEEQMRKLLEDLAKTLEQRVVQYRRQMSASLSEAA